MTHKRLFCFTHNFCNSQKLQYFLLRVQKPTNVKAVFNIASKRVQFYEQSIKSLDLTIATREILKNISDRIRFYIKLIFFKVSWVPLLTFLSVRIALICYDIFCKIIRSLLIRFHEPKTKNRTI